MSKKLLVADDDDDLRNFLHDELTEAGFDVTAVKNGTEAIAASVEQLFDLFLLDMLMPGLDGLQTIRILRKTAPGVPILGLTGYASQSYMLQAVAHYGVICLSKPVVISVLIKQINDCLQVALAE